MANLVAVGFGFLCMGVVLAMVFGAVERREKTVFVAGVVLLAAGPTLVGTVSAPELLGGLVALVGFLAIASSTVPLLRQSATTA